MDKKYFMIRQKTIPYREEKVPIDNLAFYPKNPRIHSWLASNELRDQAEIQKRLAEVEHVKELCIQIERDGQVNDPLVCTEILDDSDLASSFEYEVLEGNRRLAALRALNASGRLLQEEVWCQILDFSKQPDSDRESLIFSLLGGFHIKGKRKWDGYELAAFIHERNIVQNAGVEMVAEESGLSEKQVQNITDAYIMMRNFDDGKKSNWSYYFSYMASARIAKHRDKQQQGQLDKRVAEMIKRGVVPNATTFRDMLPLILDQRDAKKTFMKEDISEAFEDATTIVQESGSGNPAMKRLMNMCVRFGAEKFQDDVVDLLRNPKVKSQAADQLDDIMHHINAILRKAQKND